MKRLAAAGCVLIGSLASAYAQTGSQKTAAALNTEINSSFPDNTSGLITPAVLRQVILDMVASSANLGGSSFTTAVTISCASLYPATNCKQPTLSDTNNLDTIVVPNFGSLANASSFPGVYTVQYDGPAAIPAGKKGNFYAFGANITTNQALADSDGVDGDMAFQSTIKILNGGHASFLALDWTMSTVGNVGHTYNAVLGAGIRQNVASQTTIGLNVASVGTQPVTVGFRCQVSSPPANSFSFGCFDGGGNAVAGITRYGFANSSNVTESFYIDGSTSAGISFVGMTNGAGQTPFSFFTSQTTNTAGDFTVYDNTVDGRKLFRVSGLNGQIIGIGGMALAVPRTVSGTSDSTSLADSSLIFTSGSAVTETLLTASAIPGRYLYIKQVGAGAVSSASSNVAPINSVTPGTAITAGAGKWALLQSDGVNWIIIAAN